MLWFSPDVVRALMPACPPVAWVRVVTFMLVAGTVMALLERGLSLRDVLVLLGVIGLVTVVFTRHTVAGVRATSLFGAVTRALRGWPTGGTVTP